MSLSVLSHDRNLNCRFFVSWDDAKFLRQRRLSVIPLDGPHKLFITLLGILIFVNKF